MTGLLRRLWRTPSAFFLVSFLKSALETHALGPRELSDGTDLKSGHQVFADDLTPLLHTHQNDFTSAWGVSMMLALLHPAAEGNTSSQMCGILGFSCQASAGLAWNDTAAKLDSAYDGRCRAGDPAAGECYDRPPTLEVANSVWIDTGDQVKASYRDAVGEYLRETDFDDAGAGGVVNDWVNESTHGLIDSIIDEGIIPFGLLAINSIYLNATWQFQFQERKTNEDNFYPTASRDTSSAVKAHFMHMVEHLFYSDQAIAGFQILKMMYLSSALSMIVLLPASNEYGPSDTVKTSDVLGALPELQRTKIALALPKFKFASTYGEDLKLALRKLGLTAPFDEGFCGMFDMGLCPVLSLVKQKTFVNVHEKGTEAAAVTIGGVTGMPPPEQPILFVADRPFVFYIYEETEGLVLFEGRVGLPEIPDGSLAALESKHADSDFWQVAFREDPLAPTVRQPTTAVPQTTVTTESTLEPTDQTTPLSTTEATVPQTTGPDQTTPLSSTEATMPQTTGSGLTTSLPMTTTPTTQESTEMRDSSSSSIHVASVVLTALLFVVTHQMIVQIN